MTKSLDSATVFHTIRTRAAAKAVFVDWPDRAYSYSELLDDLEKWCGLYAQIELPEKATVLIQTSDERFAISAFVSALLDGYVPVLLTPDTPSPRRQSIAKKTKPSLIVTQRSLVDKVTFAHAHVVLSEEVSTSKSLHLSILNLNGEGGRQMPLPRRPRCNSSPDDLAYILFTSGTTSAPKGVMITHHNLFAHLETLSRVFGYSHDSAIFNGMVLAHGDGLVQGPLLTIANGCRLIRPPIFSSQILEQYLDLVANQRATHFITVPTVYGFIERYASRDDYFLPDVNLLSVAAKLEEQLWQRLERRFQRPIFNQYGLTETVASALYAGPGLGGMGTIGRPIDVEIRVVQPNGVPASIGEIGEIWLKGENVSPGYFEDDEATSEKFIGGWLKTGDLALQRSDGSFEIAGRLKTIIMFGGFLINPDEIDEALQSHPAVLQAVTVGMPNEDFGEIPVSTVVIDGDVDEMELTAYCSKLLEHRKVPKRILILPTIPRGDAGKPQLVELRSIVDAQLRRDSGPQPNSRWKDLVFEVASRVLRVALAELSLDSSPQTVPAWDSFAHLALVLEIQRRTGRTLPPAIAAKVDSLRTLIEVLNEPAQSTEEPEDIRPGGEAGPGPFGAFIGSSLVSYGFPTEYPAVNFFPTAGSETRIVRISEYSMPENEIIAHARRSIGAGTKKVFLDLNAVLISFCSRLSATELLNPEMIEYPSPDRRLGGPGCRITLNDEHLREYLRNMYPVRVNPPRYPNEIHKLLASARLAGASVLWVSLPRSELAATYLGNEFEVAFSESLTTFALEFGADVWRPARYWPDVLFDDTAHMNRAGQGRLLNELRIFFSGGKLTGQEIALAHEIGWMKILFREAVQEIDRLKSLNRSSGLTRLIARATSNVKRKTGNIKTEADIILSSGLFNPDWYNARYPDVADSGADPLKHYLAFGDAERRNPHPIFDVGWYRSRYPNSNATGMSALGHFIRVGADQGLRPSPLFDTSFYLRGIPLAADVNALAHYMSQGAFEGRDPHPLFDSSWYMEQNPDVAQAGENPLEHFLTHGWKEGRNPHPAFDLALYLYRHNEIAGSEVNPLIHCVTFGHDNALRSYC